MSDFITCPCCRGKKKLMGMGMIPYECKRCMGVGYVKQEEIELPQSILHEKEEPAKIEINASVLEPVILAAEEEIEITQPAKVMTPPSLKRRADLKNMKNGKKKAKANVANDG